MLPKTIIQVIQSRVAAIKKISHSNNLEWIFSASHNLRDQCIRLNFSTLLIFTVIIITDSSSCQARIRICVAWREGRFTFDAIEAVTAMSSTSISRWCWPRRRRWLSWIASWWFSACRKYKIKSEIYQICNKKNSWLSCFQI